MENALWRGGFFHVDYLIRVMKNLFENIFIIVRLTLLLLLLAGYFIELLNVYLGVRPMAALRFVISYGFPI